MTSDNNQWDLIVDSWNSEKSDNKPEPYPSDQILKAQVEGVIKAERIEFILGNVAGFALGGYVLTEIIAGLPSVLDYVLYSGVLVIILAVGIFAAMAKLKGSRPESIGTTNYLDLLLQQAEVKLKLTKVSKFMGLAIFILMYGIAGFIVVKMVQSDHTIARPRLATLIMGFVTLFFPGMVLILHRSLKKQITRRDRLASMVDSLK
jgi:hypothetical protein